MPTISITTTVGGGQRSYQVTNEYTSGSKAELEEAIPDASADLEVSFPLDVSAVKAIVIEATQDLTVETNDGTTPDNTFELAANVPYIYPHAPSEVGSWTDTEDGAVSTDWVSLLVTNASGSDATLRITALLDATP